MERTYYEKEGSSSLSMRRRNLRGARIAIRAAILLRRPTGIYRRNFEQLCPKFGIFVATFTGCGCGTDRNANISSKIIVVQVKQTARD